MAEVARKGLLLLVLLTLERTEALTGAVDEDDPEPLLLATLVGVLLPLLLLLLLAVLLLLLRLLPLPLFEPPLFSALPPFLSPPLRAAAAAEAELPELPALEFGCPPEPLDPFSVPSRGLELPVQPCRLLSDCCAAERLLLSEFNM